MSSRSGSGITELAVLQALSAATANRPRAYVQSAKALAGIDERIGLGPRYSYGLLLDLARPWIVPLRTVAMVGDSGDRSFSSAAGPEYTECRPSHVGQLVLDAEANRTAPVPVGLINGSVYRGGTQPPLEPFRMITALRQLLKDPRLPDRELISMVGQPYSASGCTVTGDLGALARGRRVVLRENGQIVLAGAPVSDKAADPASPTEEVQYRVLADRGGETFPAHLIIESLPARTIASKVAQVIASLAASRPAPDSSHSLTQQAALPIARVDDQSKGSEVRILLTLRPGSDPAVVRDQLAGVKGISVEVPCAFNAPLPSLVRSWVDDYRGEDIASSLSDLESAIHRDQQRERRNHG